MTQPPASGREPNKPTPEDVRAYHGTGEQAIDWFLHHNPDSGLEGEAFLRAWQQGDLGEWPDFYGWLDSQDSRTPAWTPEAGGAGWRLGEAFCAAPLPDSVAADLVAIKPMAGRTGTNLMSVAEADQMLRPVVIGAVEHAFRAGFAAAEEVLGAHGSDHLLDAIERRWSDFALDHEYPLPPSDPESGDAGINENELRVRIQGALQATLGRTYDCTRVWSAWGYGTMDENDFVPVLDRNDELVDEIAEAIIADNAEFPLATPSTPEASEQVEALRIGDKVLVNADRLPMSYREDWRDVEAYVVALSHDEAMPGGVDVTISERWPPERKSDRIDGFNTTDLIFLSHAEEGGK